MLYALVLYVYCLAVPFVRSCLVLSRLVLDWFAIVLSCVVLGLSRLFSVVCIVSAFPCGGAFALVLRWLVLFCLGLSCLVLVSYGIFMFVVLCFGCVVLSGVVLYCLFLCCILLLWCDVNVVLSFLVSCCIVLSCFCLGRFKRFVLFSVWLVSSCS